MSATLSAPKMLWSLILFLDILINAKIFADENNSPFAYITTRENKRLAGHIVTKIESRSGMLCSQSCLKNPWCTSTNFKDSGLNKGTCELNKHEFSPTNDDSKLLDEPGTTFSMFLKGCLMTGCLNGGSCLFAKETGTFTCLCKPRWGGDTCACRAVGVENNGTITDDKMTASSVISVDDNYRPFYGRLNEIRGAGAWCARAENNPDDYLQVDMGTEHSVCAVATQGAVKPYSWTESYKLHFSLDEATWKTYKESDVDKVFTANTDRNSVVKNSLKNRVKARYVRFNAVKFKTHNCLRVEIYVGN